MMKNGLDSKQCDLVMEGGGVKGLGIVGALSVLEEHGWSARRVAGTSAGAIVGSLAAAGMSAAAMQKEMSGLDYRQFRDEGMLDHFGPVGKLATLLIKKGVYEGNYARDWLSAQLKGLGVETFGDLKSNEDWAKSLPPERRYKLVVVVADITRGKLVRLPWDYAEYGLDPDKQRVADAVRASMSIPFFYKPAKLSRSLVVDGGTLSNFPIDMFDDTPDHPTFGIKLSAKYDTNLPINPSRNTFDFARAILQTMADGHDRMHLDDPATLARTMFVDTSGVSVTDFNITAQQQTELYQNGRLGAQKFLPRIAAHK